MKILPYGAWVAVVAIAGLVAVQPVRSQATSPGSDRERLIGAWHLEHIDSPRADGKVSDTPQPMGMLIYTRDGHMSVQLMYPASASSLSNEYVRNGYEASFGSYTIDERTHTLTHHVQGSVTGDTLIGRDLPRVYTLTDDGRLIIRSANPEEHWSVTWQHY
jgi:lipocalin-like protein